MVLDPYYHFLNQGYRQAEFAQSYAAYLDTSYHFLLKGNVPCGYISLRHTADDPGAYFIFDLLGRTFHLLDSATIYYAMVLSLALLGLGAATFAYKKLAANPTNFWLATAIHSLLFIHTLFILDVYVFYFFAASLLPLCLYLSGRLKPERWLSFTAVIVVIAGALNACRSHSGTGVVLFVAILIAIRPTLKPARKTLLLASLLLILWPKLVLTPYFRDQGLALAQHGCPPSPLLSEGHNFWHTLYVGLGYEQNKFGIRWDDEYAFAKTNESVRDPRLQTSRYFVTTLHEENMKRLYLELWRTDPLELLRLYCNKILVLALQALPLLLTLYFVRKRTTKLPHYWPAFLAPLALFALPPLVAAPYFLYTLGFLSALATMTATLLTANPKSR